MRAVSIAGALALCIAFAAVARETATSTYTYSLPANSVDLYPDASWLPPAYQKDYPDLWKTIQRYTQQSVERSGLRNTTVTVKPRSNPPLVTLRGPDKKAMQAFAAVHQAFLDARHAAQGLDGVKRCQKTSGCWDALPDGKTPWAFFLPFGMAMVNQPVVNFMNYPPAVSLEKQDYLKNETMKRWSGVLKAVGIANPVAYETIVDGRPIAAAGAGLKSPLPDIKTYFNSEGNLYVTPMLALLTESNDAQYSKAIVVLGKPAAKDWAEVIGASGLNPGDVGTTRAISPGKTTNWVVGNHPNVTSYQCCLGDTKCNNPNYPDSTSLIADEKTDLMVACIAKGLGENPAADVIKLKAACQAAWNPADSSPLSPANQKTLCVRARLDYSYGGIGNCKTTAAARAFCKKHDNNACATGSDGTPYTCIQ